MKEKQPVFLVTKYLLYQKPLKLLGGQFQILWCLVGLFAEKCLEKARKWHSMSLQRELRVYVLNSEIRCIAQRDIAHFYPNFKRDFLGEIAPFVEKFFKEFLETVQGCPAFHKKKNCIFLYISFILVIRHFRCFL